MLVSGINVCFFLFTFLVVLHNLCVITLLMSSKSSAVAVTLHVVIVFFRSDVKRA